MLGKCLAHTLHLPIYFMISCYSLGQQYNHHTALNVQMVPQWPLDSWNSCRIVDTSECCAMVMSCFKPWMYCFFCRISFADIMTDLMVLLLQWHDYDASFLHVMSNICSVWITVVFTMHMLDAHISVTYPCVLLPSGVLGPFNASV